MRLNSSDPGPEVPCLYCHGSGEERMTALLYEVDDCPACDGLGYWPAKPDPDAPVPYRLAGRHG
jgi:hypothetical protein